MSDYEEGLLERIAELEAAVRTAANACLSETARAEKAEAELAAAKDLIEFQESVLKVQGPALQKAEAEVERLKKEHAVLVGPSYEDALHAFHELRDFTTGSGRP